MGLVLPFLLAFVLVESGVMGWMVRRVRRAWEAAWRDEER